MTKDEALQEALVALDGGHIDRAYGYIQDLLEQTERQPLTDDESWEKAMKLVSEAVKYEREACALICDKISDQNCGHIELDAAADIIRARSQS